MDLPPSKKARLNDPPSPPHPPLGKRMQRGESKELLSPQKQIMHMYVPLHLDWTH